MNRSDVLYRNVLALQRCRMHHTVLDYMPSYYWIEPTNMCNLRCVMCPNGAGLVSIPKGFMSMEQYRRILRAITPHASTVVLAVGGESLLHPDIFDMIALAEASGIKIHLNTNATLLDRDRAMALLDTGITSISFAFDGFTPKMYENVRRGADFITTRENILTFLRLKKERKAQKPYCVLSILRLGITEYREEEKQAFLHGFNGMIDEIRMRDVASWGSTFKDTKAFNIRKHEGTFPPCGRLWSTFCIAWNGDVLPCIYDTNHEYVLGNVFETPMEYIWNNAKYLTLRRSMEDGSYLQQMPLCENCIVIGTPKIVGVPSGIRLTLADAAGNYLGPGFESTLLRVVNIFRRNNFSSTRIA
ncbi:MAG: radical SAM protein [Desulfamplus sp.]|nr:radical SAM protein [Desulfamplus sp.]